MTELKFKVKFCAHLSDKKCSLHYNAIVKRTLVCVQRIDRATNDELRFDLVGTRKMGHDCSSKAGGFVLASKERVSPKEKPPKPSQMSA